MVFIMKPSKRNHCQHQFTKAVRSNNPTLTLVYNLHDITLCLKLNNRCAETNILYPDT